MFELNKGFRNKKQHQPIRHEPVGVYTILSKQYMFSYLIKIVLFTSHLTNIRFQMTIRDLFKSSSQTFI